MNLATLPQRGLQYAGVVAGFCVGTFVVASLLVMTIMGAWMMAETLFLLFVAAFGE